MKFKRNLTVSFACVLSEFFISLIPALFIIGLSLKLATFIELCKITICLTPIVLFLSNILIYLISLIFQCFQKMTITLKDECMVIANRGTLSTIYYKDITNIHFDLGEFSRTHSTPVTLELYFKESGDSLFITNPSLLMTHLIKKKCPTAKINYEGLKRGLYFLAISTITAIVIVILEHLGIPWMD